MTNSQVDSKSAYKKQVLISIPASLFRHCGEREAADEAVLNEIHKIPEKIYKNR
jgi:hypothetical protein